MYFTRCAGSARARRRSRIWRRRCSSRCVASWSHYDSSRPLRPYLFGVAFRVVSMQRRKRRREVAFASLEIRDGGPGPRRGVASQAGPRDGPARARTDSLATAGGARDARSRGSADGPGRRDALDSLVHRVFSAAQGAHGAGGRDSSDRPTRREQAMKTPPPLSPELEALLAPHRTVLPLAPSVEARAIARAVGRGRIAGARRRSPVQPAAVGVRGGCRRGARARRRRIRRARVDRCGSASDHAPAREAADRAAARAASRARAPSSQAPPTARRRRRSRRPQRRA